MGKLNEAAGEFGILSVIIGSTGYSSVGVGSCDTCGMQHRSILTWEEPGSDPGAWHKRDLNSGAAEPAGHPQLFLEWFQSADGISCLGRKYLLG